jgi:hypothetical protein
MTPSARTCLVLIVFLSSTAQAIAAWWVTVPDVAVKYGYNRRQGPFATKAAAEAYWRGENFGGAPNVTSDGAEARQLQTDQTDRLRQEKDDQGQRDAEERVAAAMKAAEERTAREKAARAEAESRRFQQNRNEALRQLKGFSQESELRLKGGGNNEASGLKEFPKVAETAVNTDSMVVDFRNLASGLPKSVDEAIPHTPSGNRLRKGFQAIAEHDWKNALLWFKDAYNRDPGDHGLQRLVDLAQYTLDFEARINQPAADSTVPDRQPPRLSVRGEADHVTEVMQATSTEIRYTRSNPIARVAAGNMAAEARVQEVYAELRKKYGPEIPFRARYSLETNTKIQQARDGEGLSKEELNAQLEAALTEFLRTHKTFDSGGIGGSATADEIVLGGKG